MNLFVLLLILNEEEDAFRGAFSTEEKARDGIDKTILWDKCPRDHYRICEIRLDDDMSPAEFDEQINKSPKLGHPVPTCGKCGEPRVETEVGFIRTCDCGHFP